MKTEIKYIERFNDRHGKTRLYYRKGKGTRFPLRGPEGSPEFMADYYEAIQGDVVPKNSAKRVETGTMRWLVQQYYQSSAFLELSARTKYVRRGILERFCEKHGHKPFIQLKAKHLRKIRDGMIERPEAANSLLKSLRQVFRFATNYDHIEVNPVLGVEFLKSKNKDGFHAWTTEEIERYKKTHPIGTKARLALALLLHTAQRRSDMVGMGRQHVKDGWMSVVQQKTKKRIEVPMLDELQSVIEASPTGDMTFLVSSHNKPFTPESFGNWFRGRCDEAGLPQCSAHGLRKSAASYLAGIGCSVHEIMSITGHDTIAEVQRYTKAANQKHMAGRVKTRIDGQK